MSILLTSISLLSIIFDTFSTAGAFGSTAVHERPTSHVHYNIPRKKSFGKALKNYSPFNSCRVEQSPLDYVVSEISSADVVVFSMTNCHHCIQTKHLLNRLNINTKVIELDQLKNGIGPGVDSIAVALYNITGQYTVPNVFVKGNHLGGNDETQAAARSGQLQEMLRS